MLFPVLLLPRWERTIPCYASRDFYNEVVYGWNNDKHRYCCPAQEPWGRVRKGVSRYLRIKGQFRHADVLSVIQISAHDAVAIDVEKSLQNTYRCSYGCVNEIEAFHIDFAPEKSLNLKRKQRTYSKNAR